MGRHISDDRVNHSIRPAAPHLNRGADVAVPDMRLLTRQHRHHRLAGVLLGGVTVDRILFGIRSCGAGCATNIIFALPCGRLRDGVLRKGETAQVRVGQYSGCSLVLGNTERALSSRVVGPRHHIFLSISPCCRTDLQQTQHVERLQVVRCAQDSFHVRKSIQTELHFELVHIRLDDLTREPLVDDDLAYRHLGTNLQMLPPWLVLDRRIKHLQPLEIWQGLNCRLCLRDVRQHCFVRRDSGEEHTWGLQACPLR
mmetsp:Transcript_117250/g.336376  ORF Transcript_117250/g.336376 Transcript_117250/m.336376 type:complete len:255 (-) Transcript_117250:45-809(-)